MKYPINFTFTAGSFITSIWKVCDWDGEKYQVKTTEGTNHHWISEDAIDYWVRVFPPVSTKPRVCLNPIT